MFHQQTPCFWNEVCFDFFLFSYFSWNMLSQHLPPSSINYACASSRSRKARENNDLRFGHQRPIRANLHCSQKILCLRFCFWLLLKVSPKHFFRRIMGGGYFHTVLNSTWWENPSKRYCTTASSLFTLFLFSVVMINLRMIQLSEPLLTNSPKLGNPGRHV